MKRRPIAHAVIVLGALSGASGGCGARAHPIQARQANVPIPAAPARAASVAPAAACTVPFTVGPPYPDDWVDEATAAPAFDLGAWSTQPMTGPSASRELAAPGCTERARVGTAPPFDEIIHCSTADVQRPLGPDNIAIHVLLVHTARGFWTYGLVRESWPHGHLRDERPHVADVVDLAAVDRLGDGGVEITAIAEDGPPGGAKTRRVIVCGVGPSAVPACADIRVAAGGPFHGAGSMLYRLDLACDGALSIAGWEGGPPVALVHGRGTLAFK